MEKAYKIALAKLQTENLTHNLCTINAQNHGKMTKIAQKRQKPCKKLREKNTKISRAVKN